MAKTANYTVYKHTCPNGKVYIGITMQKPYKRWCGGMGYIKNQHFFRAILKYGWDNISHEILYEGLSEEQAYETEKRLIKEYRSNEFAYGYNQSSGGEYSGSGVHTKHASPHNPRPTGDLSYNAKRINQYKMDGTFVKTWGSEKSIAEFYGLKNAGSVSLSCNFKRLAYRGYIWLHENEADRIGEKLEAIRQCTPHQRALLEKWRLYVNNGQRKRKKAIRRSKK